MPVFSTCVMMLCFPGSLLFFRLLIAFRISVFVGAHQSISSLSPKGCAIQACFAGSGLFKTSLNCPGHL